jgi:hypothetical protein
MGRGFCKLVMTVPCDNVSFYLSNSCSISGGLYEDKQTDISDYRPSPTFTFKTVLGVIEPDHHKITANRKPRNHAVAFVSGHGSTAGIVLLLLYAQCAGVQLPAAIR